MRRSLLLALLALTPALAAQETTPDPTDPARYFPLEVGNEWLWMRQTEEVTSFDHMWITSGTESSAFGEVFYSWIDSSGVGSGIGSYVQFEHEAETGVLLVAMGGADVLWPWRGTECGLGLPFSEGAPVDCLDARVETVATEGGLDQQFAVGGLPYTGTVKSIVFDGDLCCRTYTFVAGVGLVRAEEDDEAPSVLLYAKVGGVEYGDRTGLQSEEPLPRPRVTSIRRAFPNPFADHFTIAVDHPRTGAVMVDVFDVLGRRVYHDEPVVPLGRTELRLDLPPGAPGVYTVRVRSASDRWPARPVRLVRTR